MSIKLYGYTATPRVQKVLIAARLGKVDLTFENFHPRHTTEEALKEYKKKNPSGTVPTLETPEGCIYESNAILRYIARISTEGKLYGASKWEESQVDQFIDWGATLLDAAVAAYGVNILGYAPYNEAAQAAAREKVNNAFKTLNAQLEGKQYLVGNQITIADVAVAITLIFYYRFYSDDSSRKQFPNITKYVESLTSLDAFKQELGRLIVAKTPFPNYTGPIPQPAKPEEAKKAEPKPKAAPVKKEAAPKKKKDQDDDDDDEPKEKQAKNPLDSLPPSSFNLFDFKTLIVNAPDKKAATQTFFEQFDAEGYSCWRMEYEKAEGEGRVLFLTSNLMNGFLQRLESFRKYSFGVVGVYGEEPDLQIRGAWVWRGNEIPLDIKEHPSGEWYKFRKLDIKNSAEDRQTLEDYWVKQNEDEDVVEGLKARDIKYFK